MHPDEKQIIHMILKLWIRGEEMICREEIFRADEQLRKHRHIPATKITNGQI